MSFEDNAFDAVLALYVASVVPNPARFAGEMRRVCKPGGTIVIVNHFTSPNPAVRWIEKRLAPLAGKIGFHADFPLDTFLEGEPAHGARDAAEQSVRLLEAAALRQREELSRILCGCGGRGRRRASRWSDRSPRPSRRGRDSG